MGTGFLAIARRHRFQRFLMAASPESGLLPKATRRLMPKALTPALACALTALACSHQEGVALSGSVQDPSGSRIPHALVLITDAKTGGAEAATAGADGSFRIEGLAPSSYRVEVRGPGGFEPSVQALDLAADQHLDVMLRIGPIVEEIVISGAPPHAESGQPGERRRRIRVGGNVRKARLVRYVTPAYPADAAREGVEGTVFMEAVIGTEGRVAGLSTLNSRVDERLAAAASDAVLQWHYEPTLLNGRPVEVAATVSVAFDLP